MQSDGMTTSFINTLVLEIDAICQKHKHNIAESIITIHLRNMLNKYVSETD